MSKSIKNSDQESVINMDSQIVLEEVKVNPIKIEFDLTIEEAKMNVSAITGKQVVIISGIAFHEGPNKNNWEISRKGADFISKQMMNADVTLNHPEPDAFGFSRNMNGEVEEAVVGLVSSTIIEDFADSTWNVRYTAEIRRPELFEALESGLWLRSDYGVSIGGSGIPDSETEDGVLIFGSDFDFDHLAIVHRPAYERANIEEAVRVKVNDLPPATASETEIDTGLKYQPTSCEVQGEIVVAMTEEEIIEDEADNSLQLKAEIDEMKAQLILANGKVAEFEEKEAAVAEADRQQLVEKASGFGLTGHEELPSGVIASLIDSWEAAHPTPEVVEMRPVASVESDFVKTDDAPQKVVSNWINGEHITTEETTYEHYFNLWANAWNKHSSGVEKAQQYNEVKEMI